MKEKDIEKVREDRLDLPRVDIIPDPSRMATKEGAKLARNSFRIAKP